MSSTQMRLRGVPAAGGVSISTQPPLYFEAIVPDGHQPNSTPSELAYIEAYNRAVYRQRHAITLAQRKIWDFLLTKTKFWDVRTIEHFFHPNHAESFRIFKTIHSQDPHTFAELGPLSLDDFGPFFTTVNRLIDDRLEDNTKAFESVNGP